MILLPIALVFAGYSIASWGYVLVKGDNITLREWFSPLHPWSGPLDKNGKVPQGSIFPTSGKGSTGSAGGSSGPAPQQQAGRQALRTQGRPPVQ